MKTGFNTFIIINILFVGALGKLFRGCSKADDVVHAGTYVKNLDNVPYQTNYKTMGRYLTAESVIKDPMMLKKNLEAAEIVDKKVVYDLKLKNPEIEKEIIRIDKNFLPSEKHAEYAKIIDRYSDKIDFTDYQSLFKTIKIAKKIKQFCMLDGNVDDHNFEEKTENLSLKQNGFTLKIPDGFYLLDSLKSSLAEKTFVKENTSINIYSFKKNKEKSLEEWKNHKEQNHKTLTIFGEKDNMITYFVADHHEKMYGCLTILKKGNKVLFVDLGFDNHFEFLKNYKSLLSEIFVIEDKSKIP